MAMLTYGDATTTGITRRRRGKRWHYLGPGGDRIADKAEIARLDTLAVPPAYTRVWFSPDPAAHLQATGYDARGRKQYRYHPDFRAGREADKYDRCLSFGSALHKVRAAVARDIAVPGLGRDKVIAAVIRLLDSGHIRVGNDCYARANDSYGATTLLNEHSEVRGKRVKLEYRGKSGKTQRVVIADASLAKIVRRCHDLPGQALFQYIGDDGEPHRIGSGDVNAYIKAEMGDDFSAKHFRTWGASVIAYETIRTSDPATLTPLYGRPTQALFVPQYSSVRYRLYNATLNFDLGFATLTSSSSYATQNLKLRTDVTTDLSGLINAIFKVPNQLYLRQQTNDKKYTQEVRLASSAKGPFEWLVGGYYTHEDGLILQKYVPVVPFTLNEIPPTPTFPLLANVSLASVYEEYAGFANGTLHLGERVDLDFGGRYSHNNQRAQQVNDGALVGGPATLPQARSSEGVFTYSAGPKFKINDRASVYARVAKGFRPGGPNVLPPPDPTKPPPAVPTPRTYNSDSLISYEAGIKAETADRSFGVDVSVYHIDWSNIQLLARVNNFGVNTNAGKAVSDGAEFTVTMRPTRGFDVSVNGAYTDARLKSDTDPLVGGLAGDQLPYTPKYSVSVNGDYRWAMGTRVTAFAGASLRFLSGQAGNFDPSYKTAVGHGARIPSYEVVDLHAGVDLGKVTVEAYVKNLNDALGIASNTALKANGAFNYPNGALGIGVIRPRTVGVSLTAAY